MDHLEQAANIVRNAIEVPYLCASYTHTAQPLSFKDFRDVPNHYGYSIHAFPYDKVNGKRLPDLAPFLQSWLFFSLLVQCFGPLGLALMREEFLRTLPDGTTAISTEALPKYLWYWMASVPHQRRQETEGHAELVECCLQHTNITLNRLISHDPASSRSLSKTAVKAGEAQLARSPFHRVLLSLCILGDTLGGARKEIIRYSKGPALSWNFPWLGESLLFEAGWCTGEISRL